MKETLNHILNLLIILSGCFVIAMLMLLLTHTAHLR